MKWFQWFNPVARLDLLNFGIVTRSNSDVRGVISWGCATQKSVSTVLQQPLPQCNLIGNKIALGHVVHRMTLPLFPCTVPPSLDQNTTLALHVALKLTCFNVEKSMANQFSAQSLDHAKSNIEGDEHMMDNIQRASMTWWGTQQPLDFIHKATWLHMTMKYSLTFTV